jgi:hypothetical protein
MELFINSKGNYDNQHAGSGDLFQFDGHSSSMRGFAQPYIRT